MTSESGRISSSRIINQYQLILRRRLTIKSRYHINWFDLTSSRLGVSPVTLLSTFPNKFSKRILFYSHEYVTGLPPPHSLPPKRGKILNVPVYLSCHFSVRTHHKGTLQPKLGILIYLQDQYLNTTSKLNLSSKQSRIVKILLKCDMSIDSWTRITVVGQRGFTNTLRD